MPGGDLPDYIENHADADRLGLVSIPPFFYHTLTSIISYLMSLRVLNTSTLAVRFTGTSRE